jgi:hypothetical protein
MARHVLIFCPQFSGAQHELRDKQGHLPNFSRLLGTDDGLRKTTRWVMQRGILGQFRGARDKLYGHPTQVFPSQDLVWFRFEVLETTGNLTEGVLAGGGFYFPEGFPFQTCN